MKLLLNSCRSAEEMGKVVGLLFSTDVDGGSHHLKLRAIPAHHGTRSPGSQVAVEIQRAGGPTAHASAPGLPARWDGAVYIREFLLLVLRARLGIATGWRVSQRVPTTVITTNSAARSAWVEGPGR